MAFTISSLVATGWLAGPALRLWLYREHGVSNQRIGRAIVGTLIGLRGGLQSGSSRLACCRHLVEAAR
jgi:hypothetical protein